MMTTSHQRRRIRLSASRVSSSGLRVDWSAANGSGGGEEFMLQNNTMKYAAPTCFMMRRIWREGLRLTTVLTELCRTDADGGAPRRAAGDAAPSRRAGGAAPRGGARGRRAERRRGARRYFAALAFNLARLQRLERVLAAARAAGLRLMPLKGALLARTHYGDPGARPMVDVDSCARRASSSAPSSCAAISA